MIRVEPDERCLRGLSERLVLSERVALDELVETCRRVLGDRCVAATEQWGQQRVVRLVLQFRLEVRVGELENVVTLHHRQLAPPDERARLRRELIEALDALPHRLAA